MDTWASINSGREAFATYLDTLTPDDWNKQSLCAEWTVKDVVAHMLVIPTIPKGKVFRSFVGSGFNLNKMNAKWIKQLTTELSSADMVAKARSSASSRTLPPGLKLLGALNELAVHSEDVARSTGKVFDLPTATYVACLDHLKVTQPVFGTKKRIAGLRLEATDTDWSTGEGPTVSGTSKQLLMAMAGRPSAFGSLTGEGVTTLQSR